MLMHSRNPSSSRVRIVRSMLPSTPFLIDAEIQLYRPEYGFLDRAPREDVMTTAGGSPADLKVLRSNISRTMRHRERSRGALRRDHSGALETIGNSHTIGKNAPMQSPLYIVLMTDPANP